jgi:hypothetical protein
MLLRFDVRPHIFRRHQPDDVSMRRHDPAHMVGAAARLHRDHARRQLRDEANQSLPPHPTALHHRSSRVHADDAAYVLTEIDPDDCYAHALLHSVHPTALEPSREGRAIL